MSESIDLAAEASGADDDAAERKRAHMLARKRAYNEAHKEERRAKERARRLAFTNEQKEKERQRISAYQKTPQRREYQRNYRQSHKEEHNAYQSARYASNEKVREQRAAYRASRNEELRAYNRAYSLEHREEKNASAREWRKNNPEKTKAMSRKGNERRHNDPVRQAHHLKRRSNYKRDVLKPKRQANTLPTMFSAARCRAKRDDKVFGLVLADLVAANNTHCPVFGTPYVLGRGHPHSRTLDKIISRFGYVKGNIAIVSARANFIKHDATSVELFKIASGVRLAEKGTLPELQPSPLNDLILPSGHRYKNLMVVRARHREKRSGIEVNITADDFVIPERCPYLNIELRKGEGIGGLQPSSPSLDRIDPTKGYFAGNVIVVSHRANAVKSNATADEIEMVANWLQREEQRIDALGLVATVDGMNAAAMRHPAPQGPRPTAPRQPQGAGTARQVGN